ncbi:MAG TPA: hypothetical protein GX398_00035 [Candidatus Cloacimonetes bacterium]|jgi:hypothetical protein|nr:hypothetical protein [Candidatus Cloacimonas sp.]HHZ14493.1 hypothetical protein [Candidatus Cloacimonadota bacterium]
MAYRPSAGRNRRLAGGPKEPDIVPLMNLFLTIIPLLLYMLVIVQLALVALNFTPSGGGGGGGIQGPGGDGADEKKIEIYIMDQDASDRGLFPGFEIREPGQETHKIEALGKDVNDEYVYDFQALNEVLKQIRERNPNQTQISVSPYPSILYGPLIKTIDLCKHNSFTNVMYKPVGIGYF